MKHILKYLVISWLMCLLISVAYTQPNITRVEYYIDTDPGFGNATSVGITSSTDVQNAVIPINPASVTEGVHHFYVRAKDANGNWSLTNTLLFYKPYGNTIPPAAAVAKMNKLEYYIDTDPGYGNGVPVALDSVTNFADYIVPINVTGLATGGHTFWVRGLDKNGNWSMMNNWAFTVPSLIAAPSIVVNSITKKANCSSESFEVSYDKSGSYNTGNVFNVELSDNAGSFGAPVIIGSFAGPGNAIIKATLPSHLSEGANYKIRVSSTNPSVAGVATAFAITVHDRPIKQTVTGNDNPNSGSPFTYSVPSFTGSTWAWIAPTATIIQSANNADLLFNVEGEQTIKVVETNQFGCIGDTSLKTVLVMGPLPVTFVSFTATAQKDKIILQWSTATESNSKEFIIQRSLDGNNFETIGTVPAAGNSNTLRNYGFDDIQSTSLKGQVIFYRIMETDMDGKSFYTDVKNVRITDGKNKFTLVYNPVKNEALLNYECVEKDVVFIRVADHLGRVVLMKKLEVFAGSNPIKLETGNLSKGIYEVELRSNKDHGMVRMLKE